MGAAKFGDAARNAVSAGIVFSDISGQNCFGKLLRDTGHSRVPEPPDNGTAEHNATVDEIITMTVQVFGPKFWIYAGGSVSFGIESPSVRRSVGGTPFFSQRWR